MAESSVMEILTNKTLGERLIACSLLSETELNQASAWLSSLDQDLDRDLAEKSLVLQGWLTPFQAAAVCGGRLSDLHIGNYDVLDRLGGGGMGTVFKARHRRMKRTVAVKVLSWGLSENNSFAQRFQREVETAARLVHPNIVVAHDADVCEAGHFLVMEYVSGTDLDRLVRKRGVVSPRMAASFVLQAARGLSHAHASKVIHRDIKPANLLLDRSGVVKVTDFGLVRQSELLSPVDAGEAALTKAGGLLGTVDFMPPEQAFNPSLVDHRADMYGLGCSLFYLLMGRPPFLGETPMETLLYHRLEPIPSLMKLHCDVPLELDDIFQRLVAKQPADRFSAMSVVVELLEQSGIPLSEGELQRELQDSKYSGLFSLSEATGSRQVLVQPLQPVNRKSSEPIDRTVQNVLIADSSVTVRAHLRKTLMGLGFTRFFEVADGVAALESVSHSSPALCVTGLNLPRLDGAGLITAIRQTPQGRLIRILVVTSETSATKLESLRALGADAIIEKSFRTNDISSVIDGMFPKC